MSMENMGSGEGVASVETSGVLHEMKTTADRIVAVEQQIFNLKKTSSELLNLSIADQAEAAEVRKIAENQIKLYEELSAEWKTLVKQLQTEGGDLKSIYNSPN